MKKCIIYGCNECPKVVRYKIRRRLTIEEKCRDSNINELVWKCNNMGKEIARAEFVHSFDDHEFIPESNNPDIPEWCPLEDN